MLVMERENDGENGISSISHCSKEEGGNVFSMSWAEQRKELRVTQAGLSWKTKAAETALCDPPPNGN